MRISKQMGLKNADGTYPVTLESTAALFHQHKGDADMTQELRSKVKQSAGKPGSEALFRMEDISFSYQKNVPVLEHLHLLLDQRTTAIIGQTERENDIGPFIKGLLKPVSGTAYFGREDISQKTVAMTRLEKWGMYSRIRMIRSSNTM